MYSDPMFYVQKIRGCFTLRKLLLVWAYFRLAISALWTSTAIMALVARLVYVDDVNFVKDSEFIVRIMLYPVFLMVQLVQTGMLIVFIIGGHQKSVTLYRIYFVYAIVEFIVYFIIMMVGLVFVGYYPLIDVYMTFHILDIVDAPIDDAAIVGFTFLADIMLEAILFWLIKKQLGKMTREVKNGSENNSTNGKSSESV